MVTMVLYYVFVDTFTTQYGNQARGELRIKRANSIYTQMEAVPHKPSFYNHITCKNLEWNKKFT